MSARYSLKRRVANAAVMAVMGCLAIGASEYSSPRAATNSSDLDALAAQVNGTTAATNTVLYRQYVGRLTSVQTSLAECRKFLGKYGDNDRVAAIIRRATANPGDQLFTEPEIIDQLKRAVGTNISLTQLDLETCLQAQDRNLGGRPGDTLLERVGAVSASLNRCLASLEATGPNAAGLAILDRVSRRPADDTFTSARTLARLEGAVGELRLSPRDLETCVDAFDQNAAFEQTFKVGDNPPPCSSGETLCQINIVSETCCSPGEVCSTVCGGRDGCSGYCHSPGCLPADATVMTDAGIAKAMTDVRLGDRVLAARPDGTLGYEEVYLNTHRDAVSSAPYVALRLASGRELRLSPRHFIPVAASAGDAWSSRVTKGGDEIRVGDFVWSRSADGSMALDRVVTATTQVAVGAYNPLTMNGTIVVDGVIASAHSDWFLDGIVSAQAQAQIYQAVLAPVRVAYQVLGPARMTTITESWGVVDFVRTATTPGGSTSGLGWAVLALALLASGGLVVVRKRRRPAVR